MTRYIFVIGGVSSSLGKGIASAALGALLQARGFTVKLRKLDPYLNVDPGTMSPYQHGEVFVTDDGAETDLDLGHYERFTGISCSRNDCITAGQIYRRILEVEREGGFLGATVQVIPHVTDAIKDFIVSGNSDVDFVLCEIGGTVGDIEGLPFYEAIRQLGNDLDEKQCTYIHLTLLPYIKNAGELKTKPTQHSVKELRSIGIQPNILLVRSSMQIPDNHRKKLSLFCSVPKSSVVEAVDTDNVYRIPKLYHEAGLDRELLKSFDIPDGGNIDLSVWEKIVDRIDNPTQEVTIGIVGKYNDLRDSYISLIEAIRHASYAQSAKLNISWIDADDSSGVNLSDSLSKCDGILVPGGFGLRGVDGKLEAIKYARENNVPYLGICYGMQLACIEALRNVLGITNATSSEFANVQDSVVGLLEEWQTDEGERKAYSEDGKMGGTMRLGSYKAKLKSGSLISKIYNSTEITERHRHRYEVNIISYKDKLEKAGLDISGVSPDGMLPEVIELNSHPWFIGVQFHPELKSRPFEPHPIFMGLVEASLSFRSKKS